MIARGDPGRLRSAGQGGATMPHRLIAALALAGLAAVTPAAAGVLVDAEWLEQRLKDPKLVILEVRVYNGGWGNNLTLPIVEGDKPYAGEFEL
jgi:hypothetical protein